MSLNTHLMERGMKRLLILLVLLIVSPLVLTMAFKGLKKFTESPKIFIAYGLLVIGVLLLIFTIFYAFKTFKTLLNALFDN